MPYEDANSKRWEDGDGVKQVKAYTTGFRVVISAQAWSKMFAWCRAATTEVSGRGLCTLEGNTFTVTDVFLPKQRCASSYTEIEQDAFAAIVESLVKKKVPITQFRFWWHTHYNFSTFWSGTDVETAEAMLGESRDWFLSLVINQAGEYKCRVDIAKPFRFAVDDLEVEVDYPEYITPEQAKTDIAERVGGLYPATTGYGPSKGYSAYGGAEDWHNYGNGRGYHSGGSRGYLPGLAGKAERGGGAKQTADAQANKGKQKIGFEPNSDKGYSSWRWCERTKRWIGSDSDLIGLDKLAAAVNDEGTDLPIGCKLSDDGKYLITSNGLEIAKDRSVVGLYMVEGEWMMGSDIINGGFATKEELENAPELS